MNAMTGRTRHAARNLVNPDHVKRLERCLMIAAQIVEQAPEALPVFERMDREYTAAVEKQRLSQVNDPIAKARALAKLRKEMQ